MPAYAGTTDAKGHARGPFLNVTPANAGGHAGSRSCCARQARANIYVSVKDSAPSFSMVVTTLSPFLSQTCLSFG